MSNEVDLDTCEWALAIEGVSREDPAIVVIAIREIEVKLAARFLPSLPNDIEIVHAGGIVGFVEAPRGLWMPAVRFAVRDPTNPAAEPFTKGPIAATDDGAVSAAEQIFSMRATGMLQEESAALVSRAAFRLGQGHARGEISTLMKRAKERR